MISPSQSSTEIPKKPWYRRRLQGRFFIISIVAHVLLILVATYLVVQTLAPRRKNFTAPPKATVDKSVEHKIEVVKKQKAMSAPMQMNRIVTKGMSKIVLPEMPVIPTTEPAELTSMSGMGGPGTAFSGGGSSGGGGGKPRNLFFGSNVGNGLLEGTFYDLKQRGNGRPSELGDGEPAQGKNERYKAILQRLIAAGVRPSAMRSFFQLPNKLYLGQVAMPVMGAAEAPKAFNSNVAPRYWMIIYRALISPPKDGSYRFVGSADDVLVVRCSNRIVLEGSLGPARVTRWDSNDDKSQRGQWGRNVPAAQQVVYGDWIEMKAGEKYPLEVIIGEVPGVSFYANLHIQKKGVNYASDADGRPILPLFRTKDNLPAPHRPLRPVAPDGPVFKAFAIPSSSAAAGTLP